MKLLELKEPRPGQTKITNDNPLVIQTNIDGVLISYIPIPFFEQSTINQIKSLGL